jgi:ElaB/YqjD/DUF883 family membrane-anchored ribosome-binding protein
MTMPRTLEADARRTSDALANQLDELIASAGELLDSLNDQRDEAASALRSRASQNIDSARRRLASLRHQVPEGATRAAQAAADYARSNPWTAVAAGTAIAAAIAAVLYFSLSDD